MTLTRALIQQREGDWIDDSAYTLASGCRLLGLRVIPFIAETIGIIDMGSETLVHGSVQVVQKALDRLGARPPNVNSAPSSLQPYFGRDMWVSDFFTVQNEYRKVHIKPYDKDKLFDGQVFSSPAFKNPSSPLNIPGDTLVLCSEVVKFVTEYRLFVDQGKLVGAKHYLGDYTKIVNFKVAELAINAFKGAPQAYSLDLGLTDDGRTLIVEVNDAYSLGAYGLNPVIYTRMIMHRWEEMVGQ